MGFYQLEPLFEPGRLLVSPDVLNSALDYQRLLRRHLSGDWGDIDEYDEMENRRAVEADEAVLSQYRVNLSGGESAILCIMTEQRRIHTVVFFINESLIPHESHSTTHPRNHHAIPMEDGTALLIFESHCGNRSRIPDVVRFYKDGFEFAPMDKGRVFAGDSRRNCCLVIKARPGDLIVIAEPRHQGSQLDWLFLRIGRGLCSSDHRTGQETVLLGNP